MTGEERTEAAGAGIERTHLLVACDLLAYLVREDYPPRPLDELAATYLPSTLATPAALDALRRVAVLLTSEGSADA